MIVYRGPREACDGGVRNWGGACAGTLTLVPNSTKNRPVCTARVLSLLCCPGSPLPETTIGWASPGPVMRAWEGPFASAGAASVIAAAMLMPAVRAMTRLSLRSIGAPFGWRFTPVTPPPGARFHAAGQVSVRRAGDGERG